MSKAFTKETDDDAEAEPDISLPPVKNYMTPSGHAALQEEFRYLTREERPRVVDIVSWAAGNGDRSENGDYLYGKKRLREIDRRIRYLQKRLETAEVVDPIKQQNLKQVFFGATVTYADDETEYTITIVGPDEADMTKNKVSWLSPIAKALMKARAGDVVEMRTPSGKVTLEVLALGYGERRD